MENKNVKPYTDRDKFLFYDFENMDYYFKEYGYKTIKNFLHRFIFMKSLKENLSAWSYWYIRDKDTPEIIAYKLYGSPHLYWIILILNNITQPDKEWPMTDKEVYDFSVTKYGIDKIYDEHHKESIDDASISSIPAGIVVDDFYSPSKTVNNLDYELGLNEERRKIILLQPKHLNKIMEEFKAVTDSRFTRAR